MWRLLWVVAACGGSAEEPAPPVSQGLSPRRPEIELAASTSTRSPTRAPNVVVTSEMVVVDGVPVAAVADGTLADPDWEALKDVLVDKRGEVSEARVLLQVDRALRFDTVSVVLSAVERAGFEAIDLVVWSPGGDFAVVPSRAVGHAPAAGMSVFVHGSGYEAHTSNLDDLPVHLPCPSGCSLRTDYDTEGLAAFARRARAAGAAEVAVLLPSEDRTWQQVVDAADAVRGSEQAPLFREVVLSHGWP